VDSSLDKIAAKIIKMSYFKWLCRNEEDRFAG
jgi:hypothetical protein